MTLKNQLDHPRMKSTLVSIVVLAFAPLCAPAEETPAAEPGQLVELRTAWQQSVSKVTTPLNLKYREALVKLKTDFTRAGNLENALAVDAEIKALDASHPTDVATKFPDAVLSKSWHWTGDKARPGDKLFLNPDGTGRHTNIAQLHWRVTGAREITLTMPGGAKAVLKWSADCTKFKGEDFGSGSLSGTLVTPK